MACSDTVKRQALLESWFRSRMGKMGGDGGLILFFSFLLSGICFLGLETELSFRSFRSGNGGFFLLHKRKLWCQDTAKWILGLSTEWSSQGEQSCGCREAPGCLPASEGSVGGGSCQGGSETIKIRGGKMTVRWIEARLPVCSSRTVLITSVGMQ